MNHFTDKDGYDAIRSQPTWLFKAETPHSSASPFGAYFTTYEPTERNLSKKIFVPVAKLAFIFRFTPPAELVPLPGGRGRLGKIFYSPADYPVGRPHQLENGPTGL
jgi:hypothetical protein